MHQKGNPLKPLTKVFKTREEMQTSLETRNKTITYSPRSVFKKLNKVEKRGSLGS